MIHILIDSCQNNIWLFRDITLKTKFNSMEYNEFWMSVKDEYPLLGFDYEYFWLVVGKIGYGLSIWRRYLLPSALVVNDYLPGFLRQSD